LTQAQLDCAVAGITGESLATVHRLGFGLHVPRPQVRDPGNLRLVLDCPFCGHALPYPGRDPSDAQALAECLRCDVEFDFAAHEVYAITSTACSPRRATA
jgi:hypothetical protein